MCNSPSVDTTAQDMAIADAERARIEEAQRQARVDAGMADIASIFNGGQYQVGYMTPPQVEEGFPAWGENALGLIDLFTRGRFDLTGLYADDLESRTTPADYNVNNMTREDVMAALADGTLVLGEAGDVTPAVQIPEIVTTQVTIPGRETSEYSTPDTVEDRFTVGDRTFNTRADAENYIANIYGSVPAEDTQGRVPIYAVSEGTQPYLDQRRTALEQFYYPQLDQQMQDTGDDLTNALARSGLLRSSVTTDRRSELDNRFALAAADVASNIQGDIANAQSQFEAQRSAAEASLRASGDRSASVDGALRSFTNVRDTAPDFNILPSLFEGVTSGIGGFYQAQNNERLRRQVDNAAISGSRPGRVIGG